MAKLLTPEQVQEKLYDRDVTTVSEETGLHHNTVRGLKNGTLKNPVFVTLAKISKYFEDQESNSQE